jgi:hypothetical protein
LAAVVVAAAALVLSGVAIWMATDDEREQTLAEVTAEEYDRIQAGMTRRQVSSILGFPADPTKQCWLYEDRYTMSVCFGRRGRVTQITKNSPSKEIETVDLARDE